MIDKTRKRFMRLMASITTLMIAAALIAIYYIVYSNLESANRNRLHAYENLQITDNATIDTGHGTESGFVVERVTTDIGNYLYMMTDESGQPFLINTTYTEQSMEAYQAAANLALSGENYGKAELFGRTWQYAVFDNSDVSMELIGNEADLTGYGEAGIAHIRFVDITESRETLHTLALTLVAIGLVLFLFFFFCSAYFSRRAIRPMIEVSEKQRQFVADASHELKTPVSIIKTNLSALRAGENLTAAEQAEWLDNIETGADRMKKLIQNLITLVKIEGSDNDVVKTRVELDKEMQESLNAFRLMIEGKRLEVEERYDGAGEIVSDPDRVRQVIHILLDNAIKYSNEGGRIQIILRREKRWTCLSVCNTGPGIAKENLDKVFDRFYREESARSHDGSHGLGLSIAAEVMRRLGGTISVESAENESTVFTVRFPEARLWR